MPSSIIICLIEHLCLIRTKTKSIYKSVEKKSQIEQKVVGIFTPQALLEYLQSIILLPSISTQFMDKKNIKY